MSLLHSICEQVPWPLGAARNWRAPSNGRAGARFPDNLPRQLTSFIGRERELQDLKGLARSRVLTLTSPGGSVKSRLGLQLAAEVAGGLPDATRWRPRRATCSTASGACSDGCLVG